MANPDRILIVGAGIGGLSLATALRHSPFRCELVERHHELHADGTGLTISFNGVRALESLGCAEDVRARALPIDRVIVADDTGRTLETMRFRKRSGRQGESFAVRRTVLHEALQARAAVPVRLATTVVSVRPADPGVAVTFADGRIDRFAVVVGADGARSQVRRSAFAESELHSSGVRCWRFVVRDSRESRDVVEFLGDGRRVGLIPLPNAETYVFATAEPDVAGFAGEPPEEILRRLFAGFAAPIPELLAGELRAFRFEILRTLAFPRFACGRVALLGDAAHCMSPNLAQGAALAMEDAVTLAAALHAEGATAHALQSYSRRRAARIRRIALATEIAGRVAHVRHPRLRAMRDAMLRSSGGATASILSGLLAWGIPNGRQEWH